MSKSKTFDKKANDEFDFVSPNGKVRGIVNQIICEKELESSDKKPLVKSK